MGVILWLFATSDGLYGEDGPVEMASLVAYLGAALAFALAAPGMLSGFWQVPMTLLFAAGRELDLDKSLLSGGILKSRFYTGDFPVWEKAVGLAIVAFALWTAWRLFRHGIGPALCAARSGLAWPFLVAGAMVSVIVAKGFDGIGRKLRPLGIDVSAELNDALGDVEEWLELGATLAVLTAVLLWARRRTTA
jgi:hypothetical protein